MSVAGPLEDILSGSMEEWLAALPEYQRQSIVALLSEHDAIDVATIWLENTGPKDTAPFGGVRTAANNFYNNILKELQKAICGDGAEYATERKELAEATKGGGKLLLVGTLSTLIAPHVGAAAAVIGPAVAITLAIVANAGKATACQGSGRSDRGTISHRAALGPCSRRRFISVTRRLTWHPLHPFAWCRGRGISNSRRGGVEVGNLASRKFARWVSEGRNARRLPR